MPETVDTTDALIDALRALCIDPDLGVNVVDMGFIRDAHVDERGVAVISMTLCSEVCPLGKVMANQARQAIVGTVATELEIDFTFSPRWSPSDISDAGRAHLSEIGFTGFGPLEVRTYPPGRSSRSPVDG